MQLPNGTVLRIHPCPVNVSKAPVISAVSIHSRVKCAIVERSEQQPHLTHTDLQKSEEPVGIRVTRCIAAHGKDAAGQC